MRGSIVVLLAALYAARARRGNDPLKTELKFDYVTHKDDPAEAIVGASEEEPAETARQRKKIEAITASVGRGAGGASYRS